MKVLLCHNYYQQPGGEDQSFAAEARLLEAHGHEVIRYTLHNDDITAMSKLGVARRTLWNNQAHAAVRRIIVRERPALMHCTNTFPLLSPAIYYAARKEGIPVVQSLRNYRLLCPGGLFLRDAQVCELCLHKAVPWPAIQHGCYRQDRAASAVVTGLLVGHRLLGTWKRAVDLYFTPSEFARRKYIEGGFSPDTITVKPNFIDPDPGAGSGQGGYAVFVGRLSEEKGVRTLLEAWRRLAEPVRLRVVGDGPLADQVQAAARHDSRIDWLGHRPPHEVLSILRDAFCLIVPSTWYETFGRTVMEAFACGTPVLASNLGALAELVEDRRTGLLFEPGNDNDLAAKVRLFLDNPAGIAKMRQEARQEHEAKYTAERNYQLLMGLYERALSGKSAPPSSRGTSS
jgi:glycosyltransferase involved in cell wall biosynthesis